MRELLSQVTKIPQDPGARRDVSEETASHPERFDRNFRPTANTDSRQQLVAASDIQRPAPEGAKQTAVSWAIKRVALEMRSAENADQTPAARAKPQRKVRERGLEPPRYCYRQPLKLVRLPISPLALQKAARCGRLPRLSLSQSRQASSGHGNAATANQFSKLGIFQPLRANTSPTR